MMLEIATYWDGELLWLDYVKEGDTCLGWTFDTGGKVAVHKRLVDDAERRFLESQLKKPKPWGEMASALIVAAVIHVGLLGLGLWIHDAEDPFDSPPSVFTLGTLAGNPELGGGESGTQESSGSSAKAQAASSTDPKRGEQGDDSPIGFDPVDPIDDGTHFGMIGLLDRAGTGIDASDWAGTGGNFLFGHDVPSIGPEGLSGVGEGGGGKGEGIGLGTIGTIGHCDETCVGTGMGYGSAHGRLTGHHASIVCHLPALAYATKGQLPAEVIQRVVRANMGRFRGCYEDALRPNPSLAGHVVVKFAIGRDGSVTSAQDAGSELQSPQAVACIVKAFQSLEFPASQATTLVTYPLALSPE